MIHDFSSKESPSPVSRRKRPRSSSPSIFSPPIVPLAGNDDDFPSQPSTPPAPARVRQKKRHQGPSVDNNNSIVAENGDCQAPSQRNIPVFLDKLYSMVNDPSTDDMIHWSEDGTSFIVQGREEFAKVVLPQFYKHNTFASFVRQLNMYHFHKIPHIRQGALISDSTHEVWEFSNPHFQRGRPGLLSVVARKRNRDRGSERKVDLTNIVEDIQDIRRNQASISSELHSLREDNKILWDESFLAREKHQEHQEVIGKILQFLMTAFAKNDSNTNAAAIASGSSPPEHLIKEAAALANVNIPSGPLSFDGTINSAARTGSSSSSAPETASCSSSSSSSALFPTSYPASSMASFPPMPATITDLGTIGESTGAIDMAAQSAKAISDNIDDLQYTVETLACDLGIDLNHMPITALQDGTWAQDYPAFVNPLLPPAMHNGPNTLVEKNDKRQLGKTNACTPLVARRASSNRVPSPVLRTSMNASFDTGRPLAALGSPNPLTVSAVAPMSIIQTYANIGNSNGSGCSSGSGSGGSSSSSSSSNNNNNDSITNDKRPTPTNGSIRANVQDRVSKHGM